jgi:cytochrome c553
VWACGLCHYPNGKGRQENAGVAGLPVSYFIQTMYDFRNGLRKSAEPRKNNTNLMVQFAKNMTDDEIKQAAEYFGSMKWTPWIKVIETNTVPKTHNNNGMFLVEGTEKEPLGKRILETPVNGEATEVLRDPHSSFFAYVPPGSIKRGEALVTKNNAKTTQCASCHGADLNGLGPVPGIAGRSPSYLMRQMNDMKQGVRNGTWTQLMKPVVANLSEEDMLDIVAYTASRMP